MKEHPIYMSEEEIRAILEKKKTQKRILVKGNALKMLTICTPDVIVRDMPKYHIGDRLYVKETFKIAEGVTINGVSPVIYKAECSGFALANIDNWKSPMFMPRKLSRIILEITDIRVERVQDISVQDAKDEGIRVHANGCKDGLAYGCYNGDECVNNVCRQPIEYYKQIWNSLNAKRGFSWESNSWVWVISFKVV